MCRYVIYLGIKIIKAYHNILGIKMMSKDGRICFIVKYYCYVEWSIPSQVLLKK